ncbi:fusion protein [Rhizobium rhizogenes]|uniref:Fusion protein n=1 Tax=Rhizobium rhizogenes TaxID=359 RepID=A0AA88JSF2_RHIRH|nr:fusion protein [Rhizobium rhizogenes]KAA3504352.1 fusion protein [Rhizobium rhizogenes]
MANTTWYGDGTATVAVGSRTVTGTNTGWLTEVAGLTPIKAGDKYGIHVGRPIVIEKIISDTELLLADDWPGPAQTDGPYKVELTSPTIAAVEAMRRLLASLSNGNLDSLSEITVGTDDIPIGIGPGVFGTVNKAALVQGVEYDAFVANLAGRAAYNGAAKDFAVLVIDIGDGRSALYFKNSATSGDWSAPSYVTGPVGPAGINQRGNYSAGTAYAIRDIVQSGGSTWIAKVATTGNAPPTLPTTENTQWLLFARSGTAGVVDRGTYSGATAYEANDIVLNSGSTWLALQSTTGNAPPVLPTESNAYWRLLARKGTDGTGIGDVVGPNGGVVDGRVVEFSGTTGKLIKDGGVSITPFAKTFLDDSDQNEARQTLGVVATAWEKIGSEINLAGQTAIDWVGLSGFRELRINGHFTASVAGGQLFARVSTDNGASFLQSASDYGYSSLSREGATVTGVGGGAFNALPFSTVTMISNIVKFECHLTNFNKNLVSGFAAWNSFFATQQRREIIDGYALAANQRNAVRIFMTAGVMIDGIVVLEGIRG